MSKKTNQLKWGAALSYLQMALGLVVGLLYTPIMIRLLGKSEYGLYNTVSSTIAMLSVLSLGFNSSYIRYYSKYKKENDEQSIYKLNGLFLIVFGILGSIALACGLFLSFNLELVFDQGLTAKEYDIAKVLMLLLTVNLATSFPASLFTSIVSAHEKFIFLKLVGMLKTVASPLLTIPLLLLGYRSIAMVSVTVGIALLTDAIYLCYVKAVLKHKFLFRGFEKGIFKSLFVYTSFIAINLIVDQVNNNLGKFLLGRYKGTATVAVYSVGYTLYQYYLTFSTAVSGVFSPRVHKIVNRTKDDIAAQKKELTELFVKVGRIQFLLLGLLATGMIFFGQAFIRFWAGEGFEESYFVMLLLVLPGTVPLIQNVGIEIQRAENKHHFRSLVYLGMALINLFSSIFLCQRFGAIGTAIGTGGSLLIANGVIMNIYYHKKCNIDILLFWKNILGMSLGLLLPIGLGVSILHFVDLFVLWKFLLCVVLYVPVYCLSMWLVGMNRYEKNLVLAPISKIMKRKA